MGVAVITMDSHVPAQTMEIAVTLLIGVVMSHRIVELIVIRIMETAIPLHLMEHVA